MKLLALTLSRRRWCQKKFSVHKKKFFVFIEEGGMETVDFACVEKYERGSLKMMRKIIKEICQILEEFRLIFWNLLLGLSYESFQNF